MPSRRLSCILTLLDSSPAAGISIGSAFVTKLLIAYISRSHDYLHTAEQDRVGLNKPQSAAYGFGFAVALAGMQLAAMCVPPHHWRVVQRSSESAEFSRLRQSRSDSTWVSSA